MLELKACALIENCFVNNKITFDEFDAIARLFSFYLFVLIDKNL